MNPMLVAAISAAALMGAAAAHAFQADDTQGASAQGAPAEGAAAQGATDQNDAPAGTKAPLSDLLTTPIAEVAEPKYDFGKVWMNDELKHSFKMRNAGEVPLKIIRVKPACGCTIPGSYPHELAPGEAGEIPFQLNAKRLKGKFTKSISVTTNDPKATQVQLLLTGEVQHPVEVSPQIVQFGRVKADSVITNKVTVTNNTDERLDVSVKPNAEAKWLSVQVEQTVPGKQFDVSVSAHPPFDTGINRTTLTLSTNLASQPEIDVTCIATLPNRIELRPDKIQLSGRISHDAQRKILLSNNADEPIHVLSAESTDDRLTVETSEIEAGRRYQFSVTIPATYALPKADAAIVIKTDDAKDGEIRVPVVGRQSRAEPRSEPPIKQLVGTALPEFKTVTFDGNEVTVGGNHDKVQLVMFYASWCGFCKKALPKIEGLYEKYKDNPYVEVIAVNLDERSGRRARTENETIEHYRQMELKLPMVLDSEKDLGKPYKVVSFPTMFLLGKTGEVEDVQVGAAAGFDTKFDSEIGLLLEGKSHKDFAGASALSRGVRPSTLTPVALRSAPTGEQADDDTASVDADASTEHGDSDHADHGTGDDVDGDDADGDDADGDDASPQ